MAGQDVAYSPYVLKSWSVMDCAEQDSSETESLALSSEAEASQQNPQEPKVGCEKHESGHSSIGSVLHGSGDCKPCAWFWKPQGCQNGQECLHCHLCPQSEIKIRKKMNTAEKKELNSAQKKEALKTHVPSVATMFVPPPGIAAPALNSPRSEGDSCEDSLSFCDSDRALFPTLLAGTLNEPAAEVVKPSASKGSFLHGTGDCKPCAWFWHPQGCNNPADCEYCHLCPHGEIQILQKQKKSLMRADRARQHEGANCDEEQDLVEQGVGSELLKPELVTAGGSQVSVGSEEHSTGRCRPCAWFWKSEGCKNEKDCMHCHLCPDGELKRRKKQNAPPGKVGSSTAVRRAQAQQQGVRQQLAMQNHVILQQQQQLLQLQAQFEMMVASAAFLGAP